MSTATGVARGLAVALAAAALTVGATRATGSLQLAAPHPAPSLPASADVLLDDTTLVCPGQERLGAVGLRDVSGKVTTAVVAAPAEALGGLAGTSPRETGSLRLASGPTVAPIATGSGRDNLVSGESSTAAAVLASGAGAIAPGLVATQVWQRRGDDDRGLALTPCQPSSSDAWLVGGGGGPSRTERVIVTNPGANAVSVSFDVYGASGPVAEAQGRSVSVAPHAREVVSLDALAPDESRPVVHVSATGGVVAAVLDDAWIDGATARGIDDATRSASPGTDLVIAGVDAAGAASVRVANPGGDEALVQVRVLTTSGPVQPAGLRAVRVPAGSTVDVPLTLPAGPAGLRLTSDLPVVAGAWVERRATSGSDRMGDFGWAPATPALQGLGGLVVPGLERSGATRTLLLAAGAGGTVAITTGSGAGLRTTTTTVGADSAASVPLGDADRVWVRSLSGDVRAAVTVVGAADGVPWFSVAAITDAPLTALSVPVRQVRN
ncbi:hypothetical protein N865_14865 [Intrasporangium oryzae NRRL B-24470]|uniref:Uncharacterized protein n=1 Tax=Intrasporangium oryzae NRRL B-24470 TaxID=1386089 RepID=W9G350_9MICO|nr:DUF5719 family protein [Intrasporangium oryzae]EWT00511.1 hypothetical protein N865_14865 [Intrasporangium oryzae NRRL B-24470]